MQSASRKWMVSMDTGKCVCVRACVRVQGHRCVYCRQLSRYKAHIAEFVFYVSQVAPHTDSHCVRAQTDQHSTANLQ